MKISEIITDKYKLRIPPTVYYELLADVQEVEEEQEPKTGHWKYFQNEKGDWMNVCSNCNSDCGVGYPYNYCPNCGAEMKGDVEK